jgi:phosphoribosylanthranilate isomerase
MMRTRIKICGITRERDARAAAAAGVDAVGFVFWEGSPRRITPARAARIGLHLPPLVSRVGVFVNASPTEVARVVRAARLQAIQLHGEEDPRAYARCGAAIIKAVALGGRADVKHARGHSADVMMLVDAGDARRRGGTGRTADWNLARSLARRRPILLAGGLNASNVRQAIRAVGPWGVDVSSGVETRPGVKSAAMIAALCAAVASADREVR